MDMELINEVMEEVTKVNGSIIKCMVKDTLYDLMEKNMLDNMFKIRKKVKGLLYGLICINNNNI